MGNTWFSIGLSVSRKYFGHLSETSQTNYPKCTKRDNTINNIGTLTVDSAKYARPNNRTGRTELIDSTVNMWNVGKGGIYPLLLICAISGGSSGQPFYSALSGFLAWVICIFVLLLWHLSCQFFQILLLFCFDFLLYNPWVISNGCQVR